ncbi:hypothetical protein SAMN05421736_1267 [Evansella caseinilytica]|uniref:Uncharacterized protein n=1 Tax=Evansella caseinilytica TaxID=1503961 RepID=A0A1H3UTA0_9BACI|nr:hypothetical protein [Evansella caseinilytica]SDZ65624.1 hypothetical protein SAMN05421736_1267 [Evansella caseinilytica]
MLEERGLIRLGDPSKAPVLNYDVPEPTSYSGKNFIGLEFEGEEADYFKSDVLTPPPIEEIRNNSMTILTSPITIGTLVSDPRRRSISSEATILTVGANTGALRFVPEEDGGFHVVGSQPKSEKLSKLDPNEVEMMKDSGYRLNVYKNLYGSYTYNYVPFPLVKADTQQPQKISPAQIYLVETYRLSSFLGDYGAGRVIKTFSLLPGEKTKISVKSFTKSSETRKESSSILDSFSEDSAEEFETSIANEQSNKEEYQKSFKYHAEAEASASWGWGKAKVSGGIEGATNAAREEFSKNATSALQKHAAKASAKREVQVNAEYEVKTETEEETSIEREIENINLSRTLNFIFRQMNQEFISILHLVDVRISFWNGYEGAKRREVPLYELDSLLNEVIVDDPDTGSADAAKKDEVRQSVTEALKNIFDYEGNRVTDFIKEESYLRVNTKRIQFYDDPISDQEPIPVPGIVLSVSKNVLRTEGVIVESLLGEGNALDDYATRLQELEIQNREAEVSRLKAEADKANLINYLVQENDQDRAQILADLTCPCGPKVKNDEEESADES